MPPPKKRNDSGRTKLVRGDLLKAARIMKGLGLDEFSNSMGLPRLSLATIKRAENGGPSYLSTIKRICDELGCKIADVIIQSRTCYYNDTDNSNNEVMDIKINITIHKDSINNSPMMLAIFNLLNEVLPDKEGIRILSVDPVPVRTRLQSQQSQQVRQQDQQQQQQQQFMWLYIDGRYKFGYLFTESDALGKEATSRFMASIIVQNSENNREALRSLSELAMNSSYANEIQLRHYDYREMNEDNLDFLLECGVKTEYNMR